MSDAPGQTVGSEGAGAPPTQLSEAQVMQGIEGLLEERPRRRAPQTPPPPAADEGSGTEPHGAAPDDAGLEEPATSGNEEEEQHEPGDGEEAEPGHQIEPPESWSTDDKAVFQQLPPEAQQVIARRESERDKAFIQKTQEVAEHRRALEATFSEIQSERQSYAQNLQQLLFVAAPEAQKFAQVDWQRLAAESPADYVRLTAERDALRGRVGAIQQELARVQEQAQQTQVQQFHAARAEQAQKLVEAMPDFGDAEKGRKLASDMRQWLQSQGFTADEIGQVIDHRIILVAAKAMQADRARQARQQAETKRNVTAPAVQPPGAGRQRSDSQAAQRRNQKMAQLRKTGSEKDAINLLMEIL